MSVLVVAGLLTGALALCAALLALPIDLRFNAAVAERLEGRLRVEWLDGRVGREIAPSAPKPRKQARRGPRPTLAQLDLLRREPFRGRVMTLLRSCRRYIDVDRVRGCARFGPGDPADTGVLFGMIQPIVAWLDARPRVELRVVPDFFEAHAAGEVEGRVRLVPLGLLVHLVAFACSPVTVRTLRTYRSLGA